MGVIPSVSELLNTGESVDIEFKVSFGREVIETLVAFANTVGGTVLIGVNDDATLSGVTIGKETLNDWLVQIKSATSPSIIPDIESHRETGRTIVSIHISEYPVKPVNTRGRYYKRVASSNHQLSLTEINDLYMQSLQLSWDAYEAPRHSLDELDVAKIETFITQVNNCGL